MRQMAEYAISEGKYSERSHPESEWKKHPLRNPFQRDRERIIHSKAFRRLEYKTQVFANDVGDHFRTRLTHSIEVAQISRSIARSLKVNEDIAETIALAHDLGHPPFGHAGERALHLLMKEHGGFDHNKQTLRIVKILEQRYPEFDGLNLTMATLIGLQKHDHLPENQSHSIEALLVDISDGIAYNNHDLYDGLDSSLISLHELKKIELWEYHWSHTTKKYPATREDVQIHYSIRCMMNQIVMNLVEQTQMNLKRFNINELKDVLHFHENHPNEKLVDFSKELGQKLNQLKKFLFKNLYSHPKIEERNQKTKNVIESLFHFLFENQDHLPEEYIDRIPVDGVYRSICDFIAGMTDRYAISWPKKIYFELEIDQLFFFLKSIIKSIRKDTSSFVIAL